MNIAEIIELIKNKTNIKIDRTISKTLGQAIVKTIDDNKNKNKVYPLGFQKLLLMNNNFETNETKVLQLLYDDNKKEIDNIYLYNFIRDLYDDINNFKKDKGYYPYKIELLDKCIGNTLTKELKIKDKSFLLIMSEYIYSDITKTKTSVKMRKLLQNKAISNKELFKKFIYINIDRDNKYKDFENIGKKIQIIVEEIENNFLGNMESGQHANNSASISDKYKEMISGIFPLYYNIGVKTKKLSKLEMEEYIKKMHKK